MKIQIEYQTFIFQDLPFLHKNTLLLLIFYKRLSFLFLKEIVQLFTQEVQIIIGDELIFPIDFRIALAYLLSAFSKAIQL